MQAKLAAMALEVNRATLLALHLGRMKDDGVLRPEHVSMGKLANVNAALDVARTARQVLGANGITLEYPVIRHMNNLESVVTYEGTADIHTLVDRPRAHRHPGVPVTAPDTTQQHAVDWLRHAIVSGDLKPGERIPQEEIAERIGVSLIPVREALRVLEGEGQVTYRPRRGYAVTVLRIEDLDRDLRAAAPARGPGGAPGAGRPRRRRARAHDARGRRLRGRGRRR